MFRRSNSSSHIPIPRTNLFGTTGTGGPRRAQSSSRLSQNNESNGTKKTKRATSLERKSSITRLSKLTPMNPRSRGPNTLKSTPGSSTISQRSCGSRLTQTDSALKERKTIQKLSTDKLWVAEQYSKVQHFINFSQLFDPSMVTSNNIKPPSIKAFIYITSVLLREMFPNVQLTSQNYKEVIPQKLKVLHYPGTIAVSVLKTVNTMHAWPQVIGMFGWLIDKINMCHGLDEISLDHLEPEEKQKFLLTKNVIDHVVSRYLIFNARDNDPEEIAAANADYLNNVAYILEFDPEKYAKLEKDILHKQEYHKNILAEVEKLSSDHQKLESQVKEIQQALDQNKQSDAQEEVELDTELHRFESTIKKVKEKKVTVEENIAKLTEAMKTQSCSYKEKMDLLKRIKALEDKRDIVKGKIEHAQKIKGDFDAKLNAEQAMLQNLVIDWNRSLMEVSIKKPELKKLMLKETGFHKPSYLDEIKKVAQLKKEFEAEMAQKIVDIENELKNKTARKKDMENEVETLEKMVMEIDEQIQKHSQKMVEMEMNFARVKADYEKEKEELTRELQNPQKEEELKILSEKESLLRKEMESMDKLVKTEQKKILCFFVDLHKQVKHNISEMDNILKNVQEKFEQQAVQALENSSRIIDVMKALKVIEGSED